MPNLVNHVNQVLNDSLFGCMDSVMRTAHNDN